MKPKSLIGQEIPPGPGWLEAAPASRPDRPEDTLTSLDWPRDGPESEQLGGEPLLPCPRESPTERGGLGPGGVGEGDSIQLGPGREDPLLRDEAVVVAMTVLVLDVGDTLVWPLGLIVVVGHALQVGPQAAAGTEGRKGKVGTGEPAPAF